MTTTAKILAWIDEGRITSSHAKVLWERLWHDPVATRLGAEAVARQEGWLDGKLDDETLQRAISQVIARSIKQVAAYRSGKKKLLGWFVGQVLVQVDGRASPKALSEALMQALEKEPADAV